jgi:ABC-type glycerol-3-phosphate transport system permease component
VAEPSSRSKLVAASSSSYALITMLPLVWIFLTGFKTPPDSIAYPPKILFEPSLEGYCQPVHDALAADAGISWPACRRRRPGTSSSCARATW